MENKKTPTLKIYKSKNVKTPSRGTNLSAGLDFYIPEDFNNGVPYVISPKEDILIPSGIHAKMLENTALIFFNKSGIATKNKLIVGAEVVDEDYQGEIHLHIFNLNLYPVTLFPGRKLIQGLIIPIIYCDVQEFSNLTDLYDNPTNRGIGGFGHTGS